MAFYLDAPSTLAQTETEQVTSLSEWSTRCTKKLNEYLNSSELKRSSDTKKIAALESEIDDLKTQISSLKQKVASLSTES